MALKRNVVQWDDPLSRVDPRSFERLIAEYYLRRGFHVEHAGAEAREQQRDDGVDLRLHRGNEHVVVQCKHWRACQIMPAEIRELHEVMTANAATGAIMITTGEFTDAALRVARALSVQLVDGREIRELLDRVAVQQAERSATQPPRSPPAASPVRRRPATARPYLVPAMVLAGCLIATIGLSRSMAVVRHGQDTASHPDRPHGIAAAEAVQAGRETARAAVASLEGVVHAVWRSDSRLVVTVAGSARREATATDACRALERVSDAADVVVVVEVPMPDAASVPVERACGHPMRGGVRATVTMADATRPAPR